LPAQEASVKASDDSRLVGADDALPWAQREWNNCIGCLVAERAKRERRRRPYRCPVCEGRGIVPAGFYGPYATQSSQVTVAPEPCRTCGQTGVVWQ